MICPQSAQRLVRNDGSLRGVTPAAPDREGCGPCCGSEGGGPWRDRRTLRSLSKLNGSGGRIVGTWCAIGDRDNDMMSIVSPKGDEKRRITHEESHL